MPTCYVSTISLLATTGFFVYLQVLKGYIPCWVNTLATVIQLSASAFNPLIYGIFRKEYRKAFKIQYNKVCHRMAARFTSSDYSDSFNTPYYSNDKPPTWKRKDISNKKSMSSFHSNNDSGITNSPSQSDNTSKSTSQLYPQVEDGGGTLEGSNNSRTALCARYNEAESMNSVSGERTPTGPPLSAVPANFSKKYSLPQRSVSFSDTPELVNPTTEVVSL